MLFQYILLKKKKTGEKVGNAFNFINYWQSGVGFWCSLSAPEVVRGLGWKNIAPGTSVILRGVFSKNAGKFIFSVFLRITDILGLKWSVFLSFLKFLKQVNQWKITDFPKIINLRVIYLKFTVLKIVNFMIFPWDQRHSESINMQF